MTSSGVHAALGGAVGDVPADELGMRRRLGDRQRRPVDRQHPAARRTAPPTPSPATPGRGRRRCAPRAGGPSARRTSARMLSVNGSARFIWNTSGRHDTCGHTSTPVGPGRVVLGDHPLVVREALDREQRGPGERAGRPRAAARTPRRWRSRRRAAARRRRGPRRGTGYEQRPQLVEVGDPRRHGPAAVAVVGRRRAGGEADAPRRPSPRPRSACMRRELVVGGGALVGRPRPST